MSKMDDFDLDLKKVADSKVDAHLNTTTWVCDLTDISTMFIKTKCESVDTPATRRTNLCCKKKAGGVDPRCV